jgi:hypothetical protein
MGNRKNEALERIIESARRLGVEIDEEEALQWLTSMAAVKTDQEIVLDMQSGVFGHRVTMLDFSPADLAYFRRIGKLVEFEDQPGVVETALALSGSAAQSSVQLYPGDCDYFERVNIIAPTREAACRILAGLMRDKALSTLEGEGYRLIEVKFGSYPQDVKRDGAFIKAGSPISWSPADVQAGEFAVERADGTPAMITWEAAADEPGWCKLDWVVVDPEREQLANASNMLDVTWEAPDGAITPLDGYLDAYFQEVYLEAESIPIFSKLVKHVSPDALAEYVAALEGEITKYLNPAHPNYGKVAKRMYNVFRLTGRYGEAAFLRELFDEPAALLYQIWSLIRTIDDATDPGASGLLGDVLAKTDDLILTVIDVLEGEKEQEIVRLLLRLKDALSRQELGQELSMPAEAARAEGINIGNNFFYEKMTGLPAIKAYIEARQ